MPESGRLENEAEHLGVTHSGIFGMSLRKSLLGGEHLAVGQSLYPYPPHFLKGTIHQSTVVAGGFNRSTELVGAPVWKWLGKVGALQTGLVRSLSLSLSLEKCTAPALFLANYLPVLSAKDSYS